MNAIPRNIHACSLWLACHGLNGVTGDNADTDTRTDGRKAVPDEGDRSLEFSDSFHIPIPFRCPRTESD